jgi:hypothetical protein
MRREKKVKNRRQRQRFQAQQAQHFQSQPFWKHYGLSHTLITVCVVALASIKSGAFGRE